MTTIEKLQRRIDVATKRETADLVITNAKIVNVWNGKIQKGSVAIVDGFIAGIGDFEGKEIYDAKDQYLVPGFIDGHVHIESSFVTPSNFSKAVLPHGVTTVITDPHEIANVAGKAGIDFMMEDAKNAKLDIRFGLPSSVPATPFEDNGAILTATDLHSYYVNSSVQGLAEVMDYPAVHHAEDDMMKKIADAHNANKTIDGHGAGLSSSALSVYRAAGINTDHEATTMQEAMARIELGYHVMIREGTGAKDLASLLPAITPETSHQFLFCTDDKHIDEIIEEGSIDFHIRKSIELGIDPITAIQMATRNAATCFGLKDRGAVTPGYRADLVLIDGLHSWMSVKAVWKNGELVAENGVYTSSEKSVVTNDTSTLPSINIGRFNKDMLSIPMNGCKNANVIGIKPHSLLTEKLILPVHVVDDFFTPTKEDILAKIAVVERHYGTNQVGVGIVRGFQLSSGALATSVSHDSHNLVCVGMNDDDMKLAIETVAHQNGGLVLVENGAVIASLTLDIAGLMSSKSMEEVKEELTKLHEALQSFPVTKEINPFHQLSFLCLPVIPRLKLTNRGLFDAELMQHIAVPTD